MSNYSRLSKVLFFIALTAITVVNVPAFASLPGGGGRPPINDDPITPPIVEDPVDDIPCAIPISIITTYTFNFVPSLWNEFSLPFTTSYHASDICALVGSSIVSIYEYNPGTGEFTSFLVQYDEVGGSDDFPIQVGWAYMIWVSTACSLSVSGSIDYDVYYSTPNYYQSQNHLSISLLAGDFVAISNPNAFSLNVYELIASASLSNGAFVQEVAFTNIHGEETASMSYSAAMNYLVAPNKVFWIKVSANTVWDPAALTFVL